MPELPDITVYIEALERHVGGHTLERVRVVSPFLVRSVDPPLADASGRTVREVRRLGKRIVLGLDGEFFLVIHLMIAGRLRWKAPAVKVPKRNGLAAFDFPDGSVLFTEASRDKRASLHVVRGDEALRAHDPGGIDVFAATLEQFAAALTGERHTLKRTLTDPHVFSGIGNAYSDEILHAARLSPLALTTSLDPDEIRRLHAATKRTLADWTERLRAEVGAGFPDKVTAFRDGMAVHGRYRLPCPICGAPVQRIRYAANEVNYCATCQTGGKVLADRGMSRLLKADWPRSLDEWEARFGRVS